VILVDTSIWVEHLRQGHEGLAALLEAGDVLGHPFVTGELACGTLNRRSELLTALRALPQAAVASEDETMLFLERHTLMGRGIGFVDVHLLAASALSAATLWTKDKRLLEVAAILGLAFSDEAMR
jgi:predicted nucleic acid-binding protein